MTQSALVPSLFYPCILLRFTSYPDAAKKLTLADTREPTQEDYDWAWADAATLGRRMPSFEEFSSLVRQSELRDLQRKAEMEFTVEDFILNGDEELFKFLKTCDKTHRFNNPSIQAYFLTMQTSIQQV